MMEWGAGPGVQGCSSFADADGPGGQLRWREETGRWGVAEPLQSAVRMGGLPSAQIFITGMLQQP